jgi:predicted KAP-like P-loop ATPase
MTAKGPPGGGETPGAIALWDDNPSTIDLLGFDAVVAPVLAAVRMPDLDPLTIGIHGPWGGGKSTILGLLAAELADDDYLVVRTNPWEFDDQADVKGTLIAQVLGELQVRFGDDAGIQDRIGDLLKRISWSRATLALAKGALTMQWDIDKLVDAFTPKPKETPETMAGFRESFAGLVE